jgi:hypothetical protein
LPRAYSGGIGTGSATTGIVYGIARVGGSCGIGGKFPFLLIIVVDEKKNQFKKHYIYFLD